MNDAPSTPSTNATDGWLDNVPFDEITLGQSAQVLRTLSRADIEAFALAAGDANPAFLDEDFARQTHFQGVVAPGMLAANMISALLGTEFPGPGSIYCKQDVEFLHPIRIGDTLTVRAEVTAKNASTHRVQLACTIHNQHGQLAVRGQAEVIPPRQKLRYRAKPQATVFDPVARQQALLARAKDIPPVRCAVVHPCDKESLGGALEAARLGLIVPVLIGPQAKMHKVIADNQFDISAAELVYVEHSHAAATKAAELAASGQVAMIMKGSLHTDELLSAIITTPALRTGRRMSHVFRFDVPLYPKPLLITDAAINIAPTLDEKRDIAQNAIDFARLMGTPVPKVAIVSAVETVNSKIASTLDAAALCKMADRKQITGGLLDGPLAFDNAISPEAVRIKGIESQVAGEADIILAPDLESGNMLAKQLEHLAGASGAGIVLGARIPVALTSRADGPQARVTSALLGVLIAHDAAQKAAANAVKT